MWHVHNNVRVAPNAVVLCYRLSGRCRELAQRNVMYEQSIAQGSSAKVWVKVGSSRSGL
jgi:hypothetical protein